MYSFQGACTYVLAKDKVDDSFEIRVSNVRCGTSSVSCTKSVHVRLFTTELHLIRDSDTHLGNYSLTSSVYESAGFSVTRSGLFIVIYSEQLGLTFFWDQGQFCRLISQIHSKVLYTEYYP